MKRRVRGGRNFFSNKWHHQVFYLNDSSTNGDDGLSGLIESFTFPVTIKIVSSRNNGKNASKMIGRYIADRKSELKYSRGMGDTARESVKRQISDLERMSRRVASGNASLHNVKATFRVSSPHPVKLKEKGGTFTSVMELMGLFLRRVTHFTAKRLEMEYSPFRSNGRDYLMDSVSLAGLLPLGFEEPPARGAFAIGVDDLTEKPVFMDIFGGSSYNVLVFGETGSGKSFFSKVLLLRSIAMDTADEIIVVDPLNEYSQILDTDTRVVALDGGSFSDPWKEGAVSGTRNTILEISSLLEGESQSTVRRVLESVYRRITSDPGKRRIVLLDEAHLFLYSNDILEILSRMVRHSRHYNTAVITVTQNMEDLSRSRTSSVISENSRTVIMFRSKSISQADIHRFGLDGFEDADTQELMGGKNSPYSECLILKDNRMRKTRILSTEYEKDAIGKA